MIERRNLDNYIGWANDFYFQNKSGINFPLFTSIAFDLTVTSLFSTVTRGDVLYLYDGVDTQSTLEEN